MKYMPALLVLAGLGLSGCSHDPAATGRQYAGSPGSTYDAAGNPAQAHGATSYDPASPLTPHDYGNGGAPMAAR